MNASNFNIDVTVQSNYVIINPKELHFNYNLEPVTKSFTPSFPDHPLRHDARDHDDVCGGTSTELGADQEGVPLLQLPNWQGNLIMSVFVLLTNKGRFDIFSPF
jgi:hypothetical protein